MLMSQSAGPAIPAEAVGPVLIRGPVAEALVQAIVATNADAQVIDRGAYLRVLVPRCCRLSRAAAEAQLGATFNLPADLEEVMPSFKGRLIITEQEVIWQAGGER
jgi:toluene monooxygenase system protein D